MAGRSELLSRPSNFTPVKIEFRLATPIALSYPYLNFDGLIAHLWLRATLGEKYRALPTKRVIDFTYGPEFPLKPFEANGRRIYHASVSLIDTENPEEAFNTLKVKVTRIYKRFHQKNLDWEKLRVKSIQIASGYFRSFIISIPYIPARRVIFYANADPEKLDYLLSGLVGLGKKTAIGFGMIRDYKITDTKKDYSIVKDGYAMRPIPREFLRAYEELIPLAYKPPYWYSKNITLCSPPFSKVELEGY